MGITILVFILILSVIVFAHEFGHFTMARKTGIAVEEFGFGFPPRAIGIQRRRKASRSHHSKWRIIKGSHQPDDGNTNTVYSINWIPVGGFVRVKGEQGDNYHEKDSFQSKKIWQRGIFISAGVIMNFILAFIIFSIGFGIGLPSIIDNSVPQGSTVRQRQLQIVEVVADTPAANADLRVGDVIASIDGNISTSSQQFQEYVRPLLGHTITITIQRGDSRINKTVIPVDITGTREGRIGVGLATTGLVKFPWYSALWMGAKTTVIMTWKILEAFYWMLHDLIINKQVVADIAGPVGIAVMTGRFVDLGFIYVLQFAALISINLAIINFLPLPALDGGRFIFLIIEKIRGKRINQRIEATVHNIGFFLIVGLLLVVTVHDVSQYGPAIKNFFSQLF
ncbi:MAG: RIP metalloprotease RseP [Patescibacteria group bacterium]|nr:RIP metalloprotease RseP [Patescibacteria group bacterium]